MKNEGLKQANILANWFEMNDKQIDDVIVTIKLKNDMIYKIMTDGSIVKISNDIHNNHAFANADEAIKSAEANASAKDDAIFEIELPIERFKKERGITDDELGQAFDDMKVKDIKDNVAFLTYAGNKEEEPETIAVDIQRKYGVRPISIKRK